MLDLRSLVDLTGNVADTVLNTIPTGDLSTVAGVPAITPYENARLLYAVWDELVAGTPIKTAKIVTTDLVDPANGYDLGSTFPPDVIAERLDLPFRSGAVQPHYSQTVAAKIQCLLHWLYPAASSRVGVTMGPNPGGNSGAASYAFTLAAKTAGAWGADALSVATWPAGRYALLGWELSAVTKRAAVRFVHGDFGGYRPGAHTPQADLAVTVNETSLPPWMQAKGYQFAALSRVLGLPCCPVFTVSSQGSGLTSEILDLTVDTPKLRINVQQIQR